MADKEASVDQVDDIIDPMDKLDEVAKALMPQDLEEGVLIPLKTTLELRDDHQCGRVLITRSPVKSASAVIRLAFRCFPLLFHSELKSESVLVCCSFVCCCYFGPATSWQPY